MAQIVPQNPGIGARLGAGFSSGLGESLQQLSQQKAAQLAQRSLYNTLIAANVPPEHAAYLSHPSITPQERAAYWQRAGSQENGQQPQEGQDIQSTLQQLSPEEPQPQQQPQIPALTGRDALMRALQDYQQKQQQQQTPQQAMQQQAPNQGAGQLQQRPTGQAQPNDLRTQKPPSVGEILSRPSPSEARQERRHQQTLSQSDRHFIHKQVQPYIDEHLDLEKAKNQEDAILKRVINVREKGKTRSALLTSVMRSAGIDFQALKNGDTLEIEKLGKFFLRGGPAMFGGKVSNFEAQNLLSQVPNELQTDEGSIRLANQMLNLNQAVHEENRIINEVIKENGGTPPLDLKRQVAQRMEPINERLARDFIEGKTAYTTKGQGGKEYTAKQLSDASKFKGKRRRNSRTGIIERSNGSEWIPE